MKGWPEENLGARCEVFSGYPFKSERFTDDTEDVVLVKGENLGQGEILWEISKRWPREDAEDLARYRLEPDDVVLAMDRPWVPAGLKFARIRPLDPEALLVQRVARLRAKDGLDQRYLYYVIGSTDFVAYVKNVGRGVGVPHISGKQICEYRLHLPPRQVQRSIADILSAYDDLIENNRRRMLLLEGAARQLYLEWFVRLRFPGYEHTRISNDVPEGWERRGLDRCVSVVETGNRPKGGVSGISEGVPSIGAESIVGVGRFEFGSTKYVPEDYFSRLRKGVVRDRDVLVYKDGGRPGYFTPHVSLFGGGFPFDKMALNSHVYRVRGVYPISQEFLYYHLSSESMLSWMNSAGTGAAIPGIARRDLLRLPVLVAPNRLMEVFTETAASGITQILKLALTNRKLQEARDLLAPRLMSGKIAV